MSLMILEMVKRKKNKMQHNVIHYAVAYLYPDGSGFSDNEPWVNDVFDTLEDAQKWAAEIRKEGYQNVTVFEMSGKEKESYFWKYVEKHKI